MWITIAVPLAVAVVGALFYLISIDAKRQELGRIAFGCGLLVCCFIASGHTWGK